VQPRPGWTYPWLCHHVVFALALGKQHDGQPMAGRKTIRSIASTVNRT
jgi:hypothetical protein